MNVFSRTESDLRITGSCRQYAFRAMDERLEFYLKRNADASGSKDLKLSHQEIATN
jgi:hypothetical protein